MTDLAESLYQKAILAHARSGHGAGRLERPTHSATVDNPLCGDRVTIDLTIGKDGTVEAVGHRVRGCLLCEASAALLAEGAIGRDEAALRTADRDFQAMIREGGDVPGDWPSLEVFTPVKTAKSRHECVLLPFQAAVRALNGEGG